MCRACQNCIEDIYWNCIEERCCYDESIAYYNPEEDDYYMKRKLENGINGKAIENNNSPIIVQPNRLNRNCSTISSKIHEDDFYREIQTNVPILAPEILSVFSNSQIFHEHQPKTTVKKSISSRGANSTTPSPSVHKKLNQTENDKLLERLEGKLKTNDETDNVILNSPMSKVSVLINDNQRNSTSSSSLGSSRQILSIKEEEEDDDESTTKLDKSNQELDNQPDEVQLRKKENTILLKPKSYFDFRPSSENDIFTISKSYGQISMTPEIPSISYSTLPKNYLDTPTMEGYREHVSLYSIQTANSARTAETEQLSMPRYFRKSDLILHQNFVKSAENVSTTQPKRNDKSKRLISLRKTLPPLQIGRSKDIGKF